MPMPLNAAPVIRAAPSVETTDVSTGLNDINEAQTTMVHIWRPMSMQPPRLIAGPIEEVELLITRASPEVQTTGQLWPR